MRQPAIDAGGMELNKLHVLQRQAGPQHHAAAITGAGMRRGAREERPAVASGTQHRHMRVEAMDLAVLEAPGDDAPADVTVHDQVEHEILNVELYLVVEALLAKRMQQGMPCAVSCRQAL